jgi:hypothetical protein
MVHKQRNRKPDATKAFQTALGLYQSQGNLQAAQEISTLLEQLASSKKAMPKKTAPKSESIPR